MFRHVSGKDPNLAIVNFPYRSAVLSGDTDRVFTFLEEAAFIKDQGPLRTAEVIIYKTTILDYHVVLVPRRIADKTLQCSDIAFFNGQSDRFNGFTFQRTKLADHVFQKVFSG